MANTDTALTVYGRDQFLALGPRAAKAKSAMDLAFKGNITDKKLTKIRVPSGTSAKAWPIPSTEGDPITVPSFVGVITYFRGSRAWWQEAFETTGGGVRPDCYSVADDEETDMMKGKTWLDDEGNPRRPGPLLLRCKKCPFNQWGSNRKGGKGKDCGERNRLYIMTYDTAIPVMLNIPTMSLENVDTYFLGLAGKALDTFSVVTRFGLEAAKGGPSGKIDYYKVVLTREANLSDEDSAIFEKIGLSLKAKLSENPVDDEDWDEDDEDEAA